MAKTATSSRSGLQILCLSVLVLCATPDARAQQLPIKVYTTADGLPHSKINRIVKDSRGFLWFCTAEGLARFDGYTFTNFGTAQGLTHPSVYDLLETRDGHYWLATGGGLVRFDPIGGPAGTFVHIPPADSGPRRAVRVVREGRDGAIWAGTDNGLYLLDETNPAPMLRPVEMGIPDDYPEQRFVADVLEDASGSLWLAAPSGLFRRFPDGRTTRYTEADGLTDHYVQDLLEDHAGRLWVGTRLGGCFRLKTTPADRALTVDLKLAHPVLPTSWVFQLAETADRRFWIATARGLVEFFPQGDGSGRQVRAYSTANGLSDVNITTVAEDPGGNLWLGSSDGGAMRLARRGFTSYGERHGLKYVNALFEDRTGRLCFRGVVLGDARSSVFEGATLNLVGTGELAYHSRFGCFDGDRFSAFMPPWPGPGAWPMGWVMEELTLQARSGEWWIGSGGGVFRYAAVDSFERLRTAPRIARYGLSDGLATPQVYRLFEDSGGHVWVSTTASITNGLARWDPGDQRMHDLAAAPGLPSPKTELARSFGEDGSGGTWIGFDSGVARYSDGRFRFFTARDGVPAGAIVDIHRDRSGRLWLASALSGLVRVDGAATGSPAFVAYTTADGLSSNNSTVIAEDAEGHIYVAGGNGLDRLDPATGRVKHFTTADGLPPGSFRAAFRDRAGVLWFGMTSGLARLEPAPDTPPRPPSILVTAVRVRGVPQAVSALGERNLSLPWLAPHLNQLQVDFVGLRFGRGDVLRYQYKLEGRAEWSALSEQRTVTYASLAPGDYRFSVRAVDSDGLVSDAPATVTFKIRAPFWRRAWFVGLVSVIVVAIAYAVYRFRFARLLEIANMRTRIATDLHDDIGSNLTRIALLSEVAAQTHDRARPSSGAGLTVATDDGPLVSIARIARESVASMSDIVWAINPARETLLDLVRRMRQHADEIFTLRDIALRFDAPAASNDLRLSVDVRRDLLLIFKESVNNAARHSRCTRVDIKLHVDRSRIVLSVADDGVGFDVSRDGEGQGLGSMRGRATRLRGTLDLASIPGVRTTVTLTIPL